MRKRFALFSRLIVLLLVVSANTNAQQGHTIRGKVRNAMGVNLARITVDLQNAAVALVGQTVTNNEGDFSFGNLGETGYVVVVSAPDYNTVAERVDFVRRVGPDQPGELRTIEVTLLPNVKARAAQPSTTFVQDVPPAARQALDRAMKLSRQRKPDLTQALLREAIKLFPNYFDAHFALGNELMKAGRLSDAIAELEQARRINPKADRVYESFGLVLMQQKKYAVASALFAEAARLNPLDPQAQLLRAIALVEHATTLNASQSKESSVERDDAFSEAEKSLARAYELSDRKLTVVYLQRARVFEKRGERARAADELEQYLRETPDAGNADAIRNAIKNLRSPAK
jgi:Tfp pilus assembly protein PilF